MQDQSHLIYEFADFRLDTLQRTLVRNGEAVSLPPKAFETLLLLVQNSGRVLGKDELMNALWPESFVEEGNLTQNIFVLRKILGDDQNGPTFIQTIPRRGYKFVAPVKHLIPAKTPQSSLPSDYWSRHSPFRGLQVFEPEDAWLFFGRDSETQELLSRLGRSSVLVVIGNSGSGKSSLVRAGLIPALRSGRFAPAETPVDSWRVAIFRPSGEPFYYLAEVLPNQLVPELSLQERAEFIADCRKKLPQGGEALRNAICALGNAMAQDTGRTHILLVVDQFEELFTLNPSREVRERYIETLLAASEVDRFIPVHLVLVLRADFYSHCLEHPGLSRCLESNLYNVPRMTQDQLREAIEERLQLASAHMESGLIDSLLDDVGTEPGNLALLEHALDQLWGKCGGFGCTLTNEAYSAMGRLRGALGRHADGVYDSLENEKQKQLAKRIFLELVHFGDGAQDTRRRIRKSALLSLCAAEDLEPLLAKLVSSRLVSTGLEGREIFVEVSHEALIREWPALREWLAQNREEIKLERRLNQAAKEWEELGRDAGALLQGARLAQTEEWLMSHGHAPALLLEFIQCSVQSRDESARKEHEAQQLALAQHETQLRLEAERAHALAALEKRRATDQAIAVRRLHRLTIGLLTALICAAGTATFAWIEWHKAKENERRAKESAATAQADRREAETAKLFAQSKENEAVAARQNIEATRAEANGQRQIAKELRAEAEENWQVALSLQQKANQQDQSKYDRLRKERDLAAQTIKERDDALQELKRTKAEVLALENRLGQIQQESEKLKAARTDPSALSPTPASAPSPSAEVAGDALSMRLTNAARQELERDSDLSVWLAIHAFNAAKNIPVRNDAEKILRRAVWKAEALPIIKSMADERPIAGAQFSNDSTRIITLAEGHPKKVDVWDVKSGSQLASLTADHGYVVSAVFSTDGQHIAMSTSDGSTKLWKAGVWQPHLCNMHDSGTVNLNSLGTNGTPVVLAGNPLIQSAASHSWVHLWDAPCSNAQPMLLEPSFFTPVSAVALNENATLLALGSTSGHLELYKVTPGKVIPLGNYQLGGNSSAIRKIVFSKDSQNFAALDAEGNAAIWQLSSDHHLRRLSRKSHGPIHDITFSRENRSLALIEENGGKTLVVVDIVSGQQIDFNAIDLEARSHHLSAMSRDGQFLAISDASRRRLRIYARDIAEMIDFAKQNIHRQLTDAECLLYLQQPKCLPIN